MTTLKTYMAVLRAVDGAFESRCDGWSFTTTSEIAARVGVSRQRITPVLHAMESEGWICSCTQPDGSVTWHLYDAAVKLLRAQDEIVVPHRSGFARPSHPPAPIVA